MTRIKRGDHIGKQIQQLDVKREAFNPALRDAWLQQAAIINHADFIDRILNLSKALDLTGVGQISGLIRQCHHNVSTLAPRHKGQCRLRTGYRKHQALNCGDSRMENS